MTQTPQEKGKGEFVVHVESEIMIQWLNDSEQNRSNITELSVMYQILALKESTNPKV